LLETLTLLYVTPTEARGPSALIWLSLIEAGMLWTTGEVSPLDKTEILDKAKNNKKYPLTKFKALV
jgi:hypothetical protein